MQTKNLTRWWEQILTRTTIFEKFNLMNVKEVVKNAHYKLSAHFHRKKCLVAELLELPQHEKVLSSVWLTTFRRATEVDNSVSRLHPWSLNENYHSSFSYDVAVISHVPIHGWWHRRSLKYSEMYGGVSEAISCVTVTESERRFFIRIWKIFDLNNTWKTRQLWQWLNSDTHLIP